MKRTAVLASCLLLVACYAGGKRGGDSALAVYDFGPPAIQSPALPRRSEMALEVRAPLWMDSMGIEYRLDYSDPARPRDYTRARWAGPPAQLIQQRLVQQLGLMSSGQGKARCVLRIDIDAFNQVFDDPASRRGQLLGSARLLDRSRATLATYDFKLEKPAPSADSRGGVAALAAAVDQLAADLAAWERSVAGSGKGAACSG